MSGGTEWYGRCLGTWAVLKGMQLKVKVRCGTGSDIMFMVVLRSDCVAIGPKATLYVVFNRTCLIVIIIIIMKIYDTRIAKVLRLNLRRKMW